MGVLLQGMLTDGTQRPTQVEQLGPVQMERRYGRPPCRRPSDDQQGILTPDKVTAPTLTTWVEEGHEAFCLWVTGVESISFVAECA